MQEIVFPLTQYKKIWKEIFSFSFLSWREYSKVLIFYSIQKKIKEIFLLLLTQYNEIWREIFRFSFVLKWRKYSKVLIVFKFQPKKQQQNIARFFLLSNTKQGNLEGNFPFFVPKLKEIFFLPLTSKVLIFLFYTKITTKYCKCFSFFSKPKYKEIKLKIWNGPIHM